MLYKGQSGGGSLQSNSMNGMQKRLFHWNLIINTGNLSRTFIAGQLNVNIEYKYDKMHNLNAYANSLALQLLTFSLNKLTNNKK